MLCLISQLKALLLPSPSHSGTPAAHQVHLGAEVLLDGVAVRLTVAAAAGFVVVLRPLMRQLRDLRTSGTS